MIHRSRVEALILGSSTRKILKGEVVKEAALYKKGHVSNTFTLVLDGHVDVVAGCPLIRY